MNKINALFANNKDRKLLSLYFCAGCPTLEGTGDVIKALERKESLSVIRWLMVLLSRVPEPWL